MEVLVNEVAARRETLFGGHSSGITNKNAVAVVAIAAGTERSVAETVLFSSYFVKYFRRHQRQKEIFLSTRTLVVFIDGNISLFFHDEDVTLTS